MKDKKLNQVSHLRLYKKAQVTSIDASIAYLLFAIFLLQVIVFIINISDPYSSYVDSSIRYKDGEALLNTFSSSTINSEYINLICTTNYPNIVSTRAEYEIQALSIPYFDEEINITVPGIHIKRSGSSILFSFNTNTTTTFEVIIPTTQTITVTETNTESYDSVTTTKNNNEFSVLIFANNSYEDIDNFEISIDDELLILFNTYYTNLEDIYVGTTPFLYSCGEERSIPKKSYYSAFAVIEEIGALARYGVDVWWQ